MTDGHGLWLVYNGEIYNFRELRAELEAKGCRFTSDGDAEVLLQALNTGVLRVSERLRGMFAFALLDAEAARAHTRARPIRREAARVRSARRRNPLCVRSQCTSVASDASHESIRNLRFCTWRWVTYPRPAHNQSRRSQSKAGPLRACCASRTAGIREVRELPYWSMRSLHDHRHGCNQ